MLKISFLESDETGAFVAYNAWFEKEKTEADDVGRQFFVHRTHGFMQLDGKYCLLVWYRDPTEEKFSNYGNSGSRGALAPKIKETPETE